MRLPLLLTALFLAAAPTPVVPSLAAAPAAPAPTVLDPVALDRVTAGADTAGALAIGPVPQVQPEPPRRLRDLWPWLRWRIGCALPGRVCIQGRG